MYFTHWSTKLLAFGLFVACGIGDLYNRAHGIGHGALEALAFIAFVVCALILLFEFLDYVDAHVQPSTTRKSQNPDPPEGDHESGGEDDETSIGWIDNPPRIPPGS